MMHFIFVLLYKVFRGTFHVQTEQQQQRQITIKKPNNNEEKGN